MGIRESIPVMSYPQLILRDFERAFVAYLVRMLHFSPNYFFSNMESQPKNTQEPCVPTGISTENPHRNTNLKML